MAYTKMTEEEADAELHRILSEHGAEQCKTCGRNLDRGDVSWNEGSTEAGTPYSILNIICQDCGTQIYHGHSWYPGIDDFQDFVEILDGEWED